MASERAFLGVSALLFAASAVARAIGAVVVGTGFVLIARAAGLG
jgi:hypothetical protein